MRKERLRYARGLATLACLFALTVLGITATTSLAAPVQEQSGKVRVRIATGNNGLDVTNGGVSGKGSFAATGAISDKGPCVTYRTVTGSIPGGVIKLRFACRGKKGSITFVVKIDTGTATSRWSIASGTTRYKGLRGKGAESENADHTVVVLTGTVSRG